MLIERQVATGNETIPVYVAEPAVFSLRDKAIERAIEIATKHPGTRVSVHRCFGNYVCQPTTTVKLIRS